MYNETLICQCSKEMEFSGTSRGFKIPRFLSYQGFRKKKIWLKEIFVIYTYLLSVYIIINKIWYIRQVQYVFICNQTK